MKAIVTGSSGFIGSRLCHFLDEKDYRVIKIARTEKEDHQVDLICDFETDKLKDGAMVGVDTVFHLAGHAHDVSDPKRSIDRYVKLNIDATRDLAIQASEEGVNTFIFVSSVKAGFSSSKDEKLKEPLSIYGKTKRKAELELIEFSIRPNIIFY